MTQVREEELSALLDGELEVRRAEEVRAAIAADPALRDEFAALARLHAGLRDMAEEAAFMPYLAFPSSTAREAPAWGWPVGIVVGLAVITARVLPKLAEPLVFGIAVQIAACVAVSFIVAAMARDTAALGAQIFGKGIRA